MIDQPNPEAELPQVAVIGAGYWGINHVRNFFELGALGMVCDESNAMLENVKARFKGVRTQTDFQFALNDTKIDAVVIATPAETHYSIAARALQAGKDVLVEKPLTLNLSEAEQLLKLAIDKNAILMVGHLLEYHPAVIRLRELIESGELGELRYIYSNRLNLGRVRREENILWSFAPHDIAIILRLVGSLPTLVTATGGAYLRPTVADVTVTNLVFPSGIRAHIFVSWLHPYKEQRLVVVGSRKMAAFDDVRADGKLIIYDHSVEIVNGETLTRKNDGIPEVLENEEPLRRQCIQFLDSIRYRRKPLTDGESGMRVLQVLNAAEKSLENNGAPISL